MHQLTDDELRTVRNALVIAMAKEWDRMRAESHKGPHYDAASKRYNEYEALSMRLPAAPAA